ncbi:sulfatase-like hydrolase/transferase [Methanosarcina sp. 2.H.A.1B.4]|uniref:sulfatase-like hydrolase/transferase n=1 Tax=Methanosarcina sp. 2.H.A.1B.4 TaxID=1483600 RepID=UPI0006215F18|nr:sulfatase-like hydrolase/transferase [Methanosarcina sp. 2.H.A.1B.4]KKG11089.1 phosphoglycerate mutase [Methanosarcina sp. 2.H.A.1B.4]
MIHGIRNFKLFPILVLLTTLLIFSAVFPVPASALTEVEVNPVNTPDGAVVLIVDGLSAPFIYPELTPHALDGTPLENARLENIPEIGKNSARILEFRAPQTFTEGGHSVLVTGNPGADSEFVSFKDANIFDVLHSEGYLCIAVMEKGDSWSICAEQDAVLRDENNSLKKMEIVLAQYEHSQDNPVPSGLLQLMEEKADLAPGYVTSKETGEKYNGYNRWGIETACAVVEYMAKNRPGQKYLLTVNVGAIDMSGHYRGNYGYIDCIENLDSELLSLYKLCEKNNLAFVLTSDHGMAFSADGSKGGHQSEKYSVSDEAQMVPLIVYAQDVESGVIRGEFGQEDFAPTLLGILDVPDRPRFTQGEQILLTGHVNLKVKLPEKGSVELRKDGKVISSPGNDDQFLFLGLEPENSYAVGAVLNSGNSLEEKEKEFSLKTDSVIEFGSKGAKTKESESSLEGAKEETSSAGVFGDGDSIFGRNSTHLIGYFLIGAINLAGFFIIMKILKKHG